MKMYQIKYDKDKTYSLLDLFNVNILLIYKEDKEKTFYKL